ncbi:MAG: DNA recombination protein RmuC [Patescibacteria group bacterium]
MQNIALIVLSVGLLLAIFALLRKKPRSDMSLEEFKKWIDDERDRINENVDSKIKLNEQSMQSKKDLIEKVVDQMRNEVSQSQKRLEDSDKDRVREFIDLKTVIDEHKKITESLQITTDNLRKVLSNNQLRGNFGQEVAEDLLKMAGFVKGQNYSSQEQLGGGSKPDFTVFLPDGVKINIDVKFPFQALQRLQETDDKEQQKKYISEFKTDIKNKIKEVTTRDYINPEENTVDFVVMFIPNEMIFSFIYERFDDVWRDAMKNKVVMCGPFSFTAILRMVQQSYENFKYQKDLHKIISHIKVFQNEYSKFSQALDSLGQKIKSADKEYENVSGVRDRRLTKIIDKINSGESSLKLDKLDEG